MCFFNGLSSESDIIWHILTCTRIHVPTYVIKQILSCFCINLKMNTRTLHSQNSGTYKSQSPQSWKDAVLFVSIIATVLLSRQVRRDDNDIDAFFCRDHFYILRRLRWIWSWTSRPMDWKLLTVHITYKSLIRGQSANSESCLSNNTSHHCCISCIGGFCLFVLCMDIRLLGFAQVSRLRKPADPHAGLHSLRTQGLIRLFFLNSS